MTPTQIEENVLSTIYDNIHDYSKLVSVVNMLYESYPDFPVLKYVFFVLTRLTLNETEANNLFDNIIKHCTLMSSKLEKNINFYVGMMDYIVERNRIILNPVFIDLYISQNIENANTKDPLTSAYRREYMEKLLRSEIGRAKRNNEHFSLLIVDIQNFALFNSHYGYHAGNQILSELAERINRDQRGEDTLIRYCDDQFILLLPETDAQGGYEVGERIISNLMKDRIRIDNRIQNVTLNMAVCEYPESGETMDTLLSCLQTLLYRSKEMGDNRIAVPEQTE